MGGSLQTIMLNGLATPSTEKEFNRTDDQCFFLEKSEKN